ncbi:hypothetical protein TWF281_011762 [Arthrobotrys megalospora]
MECLPNYSRWVDQVAHQFNDLPSPPPSSSPAAPASPAAARRLQRQKCRPAPPVFPLPPPASPPPPVAPSERAQQILATFDELQAVANTCRAAAKATGNNLKAVGKGLEQLKRQRRAVVPHPLFFGPKALIRHPGNAALITLIVRNMDANGAGEDSPLVFNTPAFLRSTTESPSPYEETPIRPRRSKRHTGGKYVPSATPSASASSRAPAYALRSFAKVPATPLYTTAADLRVQAEGTLFEGIDLDMAEFLNFSPEKLGSRTPAPRQFAFSTPAPNMNWGNEENESPGDEPLGAQTATKAVDPRVLELDQTDGEEEEEEEEIGPLANVKARSKPFSQRLSDRSPKRRRSEGVAAAGDRLPLKDLDASAQNTVQAEEPQEGAVDKATPAPSSPCSGSEDLQTPRAVPPQKPVDATPRVPSTIGSIKKATPSRLPIPTRRARAISDPPAPPSHVDVTNNQRTEGMKKTFTFNANRTWHLEITYQNGKDSKPIRLVPEPTTPKAKPAEVLSEQDKALMDSPRYQGLPKSPMQLRKLVVHTQEIFEAERRARIEAERTIEHMAQERQFLMLQLDNAKKRAKSRTNSPRVNNKPKQDVTSATPAPQGPTIGQLLSSMHGVTNTPARFVDEEPRGEGYATDDVTIERRQNPALAAALARHQEDVIANRLTPNEAGRRRREVIKDIENLDNMTADEQVDWRYREERRMWEERFAMSQTWREPTPGELEIEAAYARDDAEGIIEERRRARQEKRERAEEEERRKAAAAARPASRTTSSRTQTGGQSSRPQSAYAPRPGSSMNTRRDLGQQTRPGSSLNSRRDPGQQTRPGSSLASRRDPGHQTRPESSLNSRRDPGQQTRPGSSLQTRPQSRVQSTRPESRQEGPLRQKPVRGNR